STHPVNPTDILSPIKGGHYVVNYINTKLVKIINATELNSAEWQALAL
ncbi:TPA: hypothetical protein M1G78_004003, partial [Salmonella enterica subsp. salamae]|nr:hypothetical protein [Salmonella enterica subsp. salamae]